MSKKDHTRRTLGPKAMEMVMRDVLDGMEDMAIMKSYESCRDVFEIVEITPPETKSAPEPLNGNKAEIIPFEQKRQRSA